MSMAPTSNQCSSLQQELSAAGNGLHLEFSAASDFNAVDRGNGIKRGRCAACCAAIVALSIATWAFDSFVPKLSITKHTGIGSKRIARSHDIGKVAMHFLSVPEPLSRVDLALGRPIAAGQGSSVSMSSDMQAYGSIAVKSNPIRKPFEPAQAGLFGIHRDGSGDMQVAKIELKPRTTGEGNVETERFDGDHPLRSSPNFGWRVISACIGIALPIYLLKSISKWNRRSERNHIRHRSPVMSIGDRGCSSERLQMTATDTLTDDASTSCTGAATAPARSWELRTSQRLIAGLQARTQSVKPLDLLSDLYDPQSGLCSEGVWHNAWLGTAYVHVARQLRRSGLCDESDAYFNSAIKLADSLYELSFDDGFRRRTASGIWQSVDESSSAIEANGERPGFYTPSRERRSIQNGAAVIFYSQLAEEAATRSSGDAERLAARCDEVGSTFLSLFYDSDTRSFRRNCRRTYLRAVDQAIGCLACLRLQRHERIGSSTNSHVASEAAQSAVQALLNDFGYASYARGDAAPVNHLGQYRGTRTRNSWHDSLACYAIVVYNQATSGDNIVSEPVVLGLLQAMFRDYQASDKLLIHQQQMSELKAPEKPVEFSCTQAIWDAVGRAAAQILPRLKDDASFGEHHAAWRAYCENNSDADGLLPVANVYPAARLWCNTEPAAWLLMESADFKPYANHSPANDRRTSRQQPPETFAAAAMGGMENSTKGAKGEHAKYTRQGNPGLEALTGRESVFEELGDLTSLYEGLATKTRQHVNPLADHFQVPTVAPDWSTIFADPTLPLQVDVGCGSGRFVLIRAQRLAGGDADASMEHNDEGVDIAVTPGRGKPRANVLGMEIRRKLVERAQAWATRLHLCNCNFIFTNATVSWKSLLQSYPGPVELVTMQFPDPHFKTRHHKRRHVQPQLVQEMVEVLPPGARVFLQGDVPDAVRWMRDMIEAHSNGCFALAPECRNQAGLSREEWETISSSGCKTEADGAVSGGDGDASDGDVEDVLGGKKKEECQFPLNWSADETAGWLPENPLGVPTEREVYVSQIQAMVYRLMLVRI